MMFPILYKLLENGKVRVWEIKVDDHIDKAVITTHHGYTEGKIVSNERVVTAGKNIGKKNETTPYIQATNEAQGKWNKKHDEGYSETLSDNKPTTILPMLAHEFDKHKSKLVFPCLVQPKLDGVRAIWYDGALHSRKGKKYGSLDHIVKSITANIPDNTWLDGELYVHPDKMTFEELVGLVKTQKLDTVDKSKIESIEYVLFDIVPKESSNKTPYIDRYNCLKYLLQNNPPYLQLIESAQCADIECLHEQEQHFLDEGYEGIIIRNVNGYYSRDKRSTNILKLKPTITDEFEIVGFKEGDGVDKGTVIWECIVNGRKFTVRPRGNREKRHEQFINGNKYIGKMLTVEFQRYTADGIPRCPVGIIVRDYE